MGADLLVDIVHRESFDPMFPQEFPLARIHVPQADVDQFLRADPLVFADPPEDVFTILLGETGQKCDRHPVNVPAGGDLGGVDIRVRIHPDDGQLTPVQSFPDRPSRPRNGSDRQRVITT